ncbi:MAG: hypothetical protein HOV80_12790 [Polyangiaceae bacterium]|nr:hypothetical protein [Polyangiaceae bacterium]
MRAPSSLLLIAVALVACGPSKEQAAAEPAPSQAAASTASASASPSTTSSAAAAVTPPAAPPVLVPVEKHDSKEGYRGVWTIDGALVVTSGPKVGKVTDEKVEWFGSLHSPGPGWESIEVISLSGRYPGSIDATYALRNGRAMMSGWEAVSGKVEGEKYREDFGIMFFAGMARVGDATFIAGSGYHGTVFQLRGKTIDRAPTSPADGGCTKDEIEKNSPVRTDAAIDPWAYGSTQAGTIISIGNLCRERGVHAEVWPANGDKPKIVSLEKLVHKEYLIEILTGPGDTAWVVDGELPRLIEYKGGEFRTLPALPRKMVDAAVSNDGTLYVTDGTKIYRLKGDAWDHVGSLAWSTDFYSFAAYDGALWTVSGGGLYRLEPGKGIGYTDDCKTPFVRLYDVSDKSELGYTFPTTTKALSTFADVEKISLVEYNESNRRLGITVPSKEIGEAVIAHVKANMKGEDPDLVCYVPKRPSVIKIAKAK